MKRTLLLFFLIIILTACTKQGANISTSNMAKNIRTPKTAGQFYPADAKILQDKIAGYLKNISASSSLANIAAIMVPHAGYDFSGPVAAYAYKALTGRKTGTVIIMCNSHAEYFSGVAVDNHDAWQTPLGEIAVDKELAEKLTAFDKSIQYNAKPFTAQDQTIEVQLPFLQTVLPSGFKILPIYFGNVDSEAYKKLASAIAANLGDNDLIIASTDMSHYPKYEDANKIDNETLKTIKLGDVEKLNKHISDVMNSGVANEETAMCGADGVKTVLELYRLKKWSNIEILKYANSGDAPIGSKDSVVGYGAVAFLKSDNTSIINEEKVLSKTQQEKLLEIAKTSIENYVRDGEVADFTITDARLNWHEGAFVTIHKKGELRGCIGQIVPTDEPLWEIVRDMAIAAASEDNRFMPVNVNELNQLDYEISVLSAPEPIDNWQKIELGKHGVIVRRGRNTGVFLPQVATETGWSKEEFLRQLCSQKAGLPSDCYKSKDVELLVFTAQVFSEEK
jgi:MEMO1 family protein